MQFYKNYDIESNDDIIQYFRKLSPSSGNVSRRLSTFFLPILSNHDVLKATNVGIVLPPGFACICYGKVILQIEHLEGEVIGIKKPGGRKNGDKA